jgi:hypothetical protein
VTLFALGGGYARESAEAAKVRQCALAWDELDLDDKEAFLQEIASRRKSIIPFFLMNSMLLHVEDDYGMETFWRL